MLFHLFSSSRYSLLNRILIFFFFKCNSIIVATSAVQKKNNDLALRLLIFCGLEFFVFFPQVWIEFHRPSSKVRNTSRITLFRHDYRTWLSRQLLPFAHSNLFTTQQTTPIRLQRGCSLRCTPFSCFTSCAMCNVYPIISLRLFV